jgi:hypothetical protein
MTGFSQLSDAEPTSPRNGNPLSSQLAAKCRNAVRAMTSGANQPPALIMISKTSAPRRHRQRGGEAGCADCDFVSDIVKASPSEKTVPASLRDLAACVFQNSSRQNHKAGKITEH